MSAASISTGSMPDLIEAVVESGLATREQVDAATAAARVVGTTPIATLLANGTITSLGLARSIAAAWHVEFRDLELTPWSAALARRFEPDVLLDGEWFPLSQDDEGTWVVATSRPPTTERRLEIESQIGRRVVFCAATRRDIQRAVLRAFRDRILDQAALGLWDRDADRSARVVATNAQKWLAASAVVAIVATAIRWPTATVGGLIGVVSFGFLVSVAFKFVVCLVGARVEQIEEITDDDVARLDDADLPSYTVLVPVYCEAAVVGDLVRNLAALDYPRDRLQVLLLLEEDDHETIAAAKAARPPSTITFQMVPAGHPQTKPKACNVGLFFATGERLVIYDAEDRPEPDQLKRAVIAFDRGGEQMVCVQAALNYWNADENFLTRMFTLEYSFWFDYMLPGLDSLRLPIPLGGTSNHFRTDALRRLGGWDPFNVTEDADLGIRASALGAQVGVIRSTTFEEANRAYGNFVRQRSRWIKGYMQTTLVHLRHPVDLVRTVGLRSTAAFGLLIGGTPLSFLFTPPLLVLLVASLMMDTAQISRFVPGWVLWGGLANLLVGNALMIYVSMMGAFRRRRYGLVAWGLLNPLYWLLHSVAAYKAAWQLVVKPHFWEKTEHGLSTIGTADHTATVGAT